MGLLLKASVQAEEVQHVCLVHVGGHDARLHELAKNTDQKRAST